MKALHIRIAPVLALGAVGLLAWGAPAGASVITSGNTHPSYSGAGPWNVYQRLYVGDTATGSVAINSSSTMTTHDMSYVGLDPSATGTVDLDGGRWNLTRYYWTGVGYSGTGEVNIRNGGYWFNDYDTRVYLGYESTPGRRNACRSLWSR